MPWVVELGGQPDLAAGNTRVLDSPADLCLVAIGKLIWNQFLVHTSCLTQLDVTYGGIDVSVAGSQRGFNGLLNIVWLRLPCSEANDGDLGAGVQSSCSPGEVVL